MESRTHGSEQRTLSLVFLVHRTATACPQMPRCRDLPLTVARNGACSNNRNQIPCRSTSQRAVQQPYRHTKHHFPNRLYAAEDRNRM